MVFRFQCIKNTEFAQQHTIQKQKHKMPMVSRFQCIKNIEITVYSYSFNAQCYAVQRFM